MSTDNHDESTCTDPTHYWHSQITPEQSKQMGERPSVGKEIVDGRVSVYGGITDTYPRIAQMISGLLGHEVQAWQVPLILVCLKLVRTTEAPNYSDNSDDIDGYMNIFRELIGDDMVHARSVDEYLRKLEGVVTTEQRLSQHIDELRTILDARNQRIRELESQLPGQS